jgi:hypothetical protein
MEGLRIEFRRERLDAIAIDPKAVRPEFLSRLEVLEVSDHHGPLVLVVGVIT